MALSEQVCFELPLPDLCVAVLRDRRKAQDVDRRAATPTQEWDETGLVFTGRYGRPVDPRHFNRRFDAMCDRAGVHRIRVHDTRHTSASLLAALDAHPGWRWPYCGTATSRSRWTSTPTSLQR